jgi:hypothetical protein
VHCASGIRCTSHCPRHCIFSIHDCTRGCMPSFDAQCNSATLSRCMPAPGIECAVHCTLMGGGVCFNLCARVLVDCNGLCSPDLAEPTFENIQQARNCGVLQQVAVCAVSTMMSCATHSFHARFPEITVGVSSFAWTLVAHVLEA